MSLAITLPIPDHLEATARAALAIDGDESDDACTLRATHIIAAYIARHAQTVAGKAAAEAAAAEVAEGFGVNLPSPPLSGRDRAMERRSAKG